tara:strand:- start:46 stop:384 length:339 start_codon:yes stop_codon:yes gene_type:complete
MKISKEDLKRIIKEELGAMTDQDQEEQADPQPELGAGKTTAGEMKKDLTGAGKTASSERITPKERDVIVQVRKIMTAYAEKNNLASGNVLALLTKITDKMKAKIEQPEPQNK